MLYSHRMYRSAEHREPFTGGDMLIARYASVVYAGFNPPLSAFDGLPDFLDTMEHDGELDVVGSDYSPNVTGIRFAIDGQIECRIPGQDPSDPTVVFRTRSKITRDFVANAATTVGRGVDVALRTRIEQTRERTSGRPYKHHTPYDIARIRFEDSEAKGNVTQVLSNGGEATIPFAVPPGDLTIMRDRIIHLAQAFRPQR
jgi:hypothetical protein